MTLPVLEVPHDELVRYRRHFHAHPELSLEEFETAAFIERELLGEFQLSDLRTGVAKTGILATLRAGNPARSRCCAPIWTRCRCEINDVPYRSTRDGVMHACGHDGHVAILLAAARELADVAPKSPGTLVFCFQPGEEGAAGNQMMIEDGALENPHVDRTFALHLYSGLDVGKIGVRDGPFFASADDSLIDLAGKGGHGAMPQSSVDPIVAGGAARHDASDDPQPRDRAQGSGRVHGRSVHQRHDVQRHSRRGDDEGNGSRVRRGGSRVDARADGAHCWRRLAEALRVDYRGRLSLVAIRRPSTPRDPTTSFARSAARCSAPENVVEHDIVMWAEDMSFMQEQRPGAYFIVGVAGWRGKLRSRSTTPASISTSAHSTSATR